MDLKKFAYHKSTSLGLPPLGPQKWPALLALSGLGLGGYMLYKHRKNKKKQQIKTAEEGAMDLRKFAKIRVKELKNAIPQSESLTPKQDQKPIEPGAPVPGMSAVPPKRVVPSN